MELNCNCDFSPICCHNPIIKNEEISDGDVHIAYQCLYRYLLRQERVATSQVTSDQTFAPGS
jgi:hypothetical protein